MKGSLADDAIFCAAQHGMPPDKTGKENPMDTKIEELVSRAKKSALFAWSNQTDGEVEFPNAVYICPTNVCNNRCITCAIDKMRKGKDAEGNPQRGIMKWELFEKIVNELPEAPRRVYLYKTGEALLHPRFIDMMAYLKEKRPDYEVALNTNAARMNTTIADGLLDYADYVGISIFAIDREHYKMAHRRDYFDLVLKNVDYLHSEYVRRKETKKIFIYMVRCEANKHYADEEVFDFFSKRYPAFNISINGLFNFYNAVDGIEFEFFDQIEEKKLPRCIIPYSIMPITWDGKVVSCIADPFETNIMGDVSKQSIMEIWNGEKYKRYRKLMSDANFAQLDKGKYLCKNCSWLLSLKTHSTENLCIANRREIKDPHIFFANSQCSTTDEMLEFGLRSYIHGDISDALKSFIIVAKGGKNEEVRNLAREWKEYCEHVFEMRAGIDAWEACLNQHGTTLHEFMISKYHISNASAEKLFMALPDSPDIKVKKTDL